MLDDCLDGQPLPLSTRRLTIPAKARAQTISVRTTRAIDRAYSETLPGKRGGYVRDHPSRPRVFETDPTMWHIHGFHRDCPPIPEGG
jgi:hypothetical protein